MQVGFYFHPPGIQVVDTMGATQYFLPYCQIVQFKAVDSHGETMGTLELDILNIGHIVFECPDEETLIDFEAECEEFHHGHPNSSDKLLARPDPEKVDAWWAEIDAMEAAIAAEHKKKKEQHKAKHAA
jgi:hypothetical protein